MHSRFFLLSPSLHVNSDDAARLYQQPQNLLNGVKKFNKVEWTSHAHSQFTHKNYWNCDRLRDQVEWTQIVLNTIFLINSYIMVDHSHFFCFANQLIRLASGLKGLLDNWLEYDVWKWSEPTHLCSHRAILYHAPSRKVIVIIAFYDNFDETAQWSACVHCYAKTDYQRLEIKLRNWANDIF